MVGQSLPVLIEIETNWVLLTSIRMKIIGESSSISTIDTRGHDGRNWPITRPENWLLFGGKIGEKLGHVASILMRHIEETTRKMWILGQRLWNFFEILTDRVNCLWMDFSTSKDSNFIDRFIDRINNCMLQTSWPEPGKWAERPWGFLNKL